MAKRDDLTAEYVRSILDYDHETGKLTWRARPIEMFCDGRHPAGDKCSAWNARFAGKEAGSRKTSGYIMVGVDGLLTPAHRLAWLWMTGAWPKDQIDHINLDKYDNRFTNLRESDQCENMSNRNAPSHNTSGYKGVSWHKYMGMWVARIQTRRKPVVLGYFSSKIEAAAEYQRAAAELHGEFARV